MNILALFFYFPVLSAILIISIFAHLRRLLTQLVLGFLLAGAIYCFFKPPAPFRVSFSGYQFYFGLDRLSLAILLFVNLFGFLIAFYAQSHSRLKDKRMYFGYLLWLIAFSNLVCLAKDMAIFMFAWGGLLFLLYLLLGLDSSQAAEKALLVVGLGDFLLLLGFCIYIYLQGSLLMPSTTSGALLLNSPLSWVAFILIITGAFAKAGCMPWHTWIPAASELVEAPTMAILPASLDKLLGIYLLARVCLDFFVLNKLAMSLLLVVGGSTIMFAVLMALIQHDVRKLLSYHAISQVGYMVLGFGCSGPLGLAGGLLHMLNNALYKSGLFLTVSSVGEKKNDFELSRLGNLGRLMPITFACAVVFSLSISGIPFFNGFISKWLIYQGTIAAFVQASGLMRLVLIFALLCAMFGSALTLASFIKFLHAVFLGQGQSPKETQISEVPWNMRWAVLVLAAFCLGIGVFPTLALKAFIEPAIGGQKVIFLGSWNSLTAFMLVFVGLVLGIIIWRILKVEVKKSESFLGGEELQAEFNFPATEFYRTIQDEKTLRRIYLWLKSEKWDLLNILNALFSFTGYLLFIFVDRIIAAFTNLAGVLVLGLSAILRNLHSGVLDLYIIWSLAGLLVLLFRLMRVL